MTTWSGVLSCTRGRWLRAASGRFAAYDVVIVPHRTIGMAHAWARKRLLLHRILLADLAWLFLGGGPADPESPPAGARYIAGVHSLVSMGRLLTSCTTMRDNRAPSGSTLAVGQCMTPLLQASTCL